MTISTQTNLAAIADQIVVELGVKFRSKANCTEQLKQGIEICDRVCVQLDDVVEIDQPDKKESRNKTLRTAGNEVSTIELDIDAATTLKATLEEVVGNYGLLDIELVTRIQEQLLRITLSTWRSTTNELKERREKRGLRWRRS